MNSVKFVSNESLSLLVSTYRALHVLVFNYFSHAFALFLSNLIFRPTNDDVDVLKQELVAVQQRMNDMALEQEQEVQQMRRIIDEKLASYRILFSSLNSIKE